MGRRKAGETPTQRSARLERERDRRRQRRARETEAERETSASLSVSPSFFTYALPFTPHKLFSHFLYNAQHVHTTDLRTHNEYGRAQTPTSRLYPTQLRLAPNDDDHLSSYQLWWLASRAVSLVSLSICNHL